MTTIYFERHPGGGYVANLAGIDDQALRRIEARLADEAGRREQLAQREAGYRRRFLDS